ncbi:uncharacterized protein PRCAT00003317001 [Priceomyces carsonii]|uniref:uncharacterized protein n=1 Tax=Priceomyces carsonii TaxID=28549 RepID=UPI002EDA5334|nr:unnamed protein product [Priceomyces carsonii]
MKSSIDEQDSNKKVTFSNFGLNNENQVFETTSESSSDDDMKLRDQLLRNNSNNGTLMKEDELHHQSNPSAKTSQQSRPSPKLLPEEQNKESKEDSVHNYDFGLRRLKNDDQNHQKEVEEDEEELPVFNKRPLTDTPIVSSICSPVTRVQSSDYEDEYDNDASGNRPLLKSNNISHLNLSDLATDSKSSSISPTNTHEQRNIEDVRRLQINKEAKENLLKDVPNDVKEQFEKTPSIEKLKNLLLTKPPPSARKAYTLNIPGQTSSKISPDGRIASIDVGSKLVIVMVGLPARGKSYITNKLTRYLNWLQHDCRVFNVGNTRRKDKLNNAGPENKPLPDTHTPNNERETSEEVKSPEHNADFFAPDNKSSTTLREKWAMDTLDQLLNYVIDGSGSVGIFDATNSTKQRRLKVLKRIQQRSNGELKVLFLESICSDPAIIEANIRLKLSGPDYRDMDPEVALQDFVGRLHNYEKAYETIDESEEAIPQFQYVKMIDVGKKVVSYNVQGFLASQTIYFLLNFNLCERQIWITRHGESVDNLSGRIGGDAHLTERGRRFSKTLAAFMNHQRKEFRKQQLERFSSRLEVRYNSIFNENEVANLDNIPTEPNFYVWTSMLCRAVETAEYFDEHLYSIKEMRMLNELGGGKFEGMTYDEIQRKYPKEFDARLRNKITYRYPGVGGESYLDVLTRLRPLITEIERTTDHLLIISHRVVLRILLAYFLNLDRSAIGELDVPLHTLYCLELKPYGTDYRMYEYDEGLDWFVKVEPEHRKNVKEVGVVFKERKYSVIPTAPPSAKKENRTRTYSSNPSSSGNFSVRRSLSSGTKHSNSGVTSNGQEDNTGHRTSVFFTGDKTKSDSNKSSSRSTSGNMVPSQDDDVSGAVNRLNSMKVSDLNKLRKP